MIRTFLLLLPQEKRPALTTYLVLAVLGVMLRAAGIVILVPFVAALFGADPGLAWPWLALLSGVTVASWACDAVVARLGFGLGFALLDHTQRNMAERVAGIRLDWFGTENTAAARQAIAATGPDLVGLVIYLITPLLNAVLLPLAIALALIPVSWPLAVAALAGIPVLFGAFRLSGRITRLADDEAARAHSALTERIVEFARTQQALRAARRVAPARSHAGAALEAQHGATLRLLLLQVPGQLLFSLASQLALVLLAGTVVWLGVQGTLSAPEAIALIVVTVRYLEPFTTLSELAPGIETTATTLRRLRTVLDAPSAGEAPTAPQEDRAAPVTGPASADPVAISLRSVTFAYPGDEVPTLENLSLDFAAGSTTAIVGPSGSGKSTVLALLAGLREPASGQLTFNGVEASRFSPEDRRSLVSMVFQHSYLFPGTVRDNVLAGHPGANGDELERAMALARVNAITEHLADGASTRVDEAGSSLSGGERQRVAIARALIKPAPILLIDEATSALDNENERAVVQALGGDAVPRTRIIVAHRLASIREAERVIFLEDGRVSEDGTVQELLAAGGRFAEFWRQQEDAAGWRIGSASS
ncbi:ABC transporter ATP-binding protein [Arthrobacter sp. NPDC090010]|uniref:ABC transporter ATP-binding protein n=1 Tax=Arthrobacter sp. NPDC090010 TaxID=3363942 RepID=UPI003829516C